MKLKFLYGIAALLFVYTANAQTPNVFLLNPEHMVKQKNAYKQGDATVVKEVNIAIKAADGYLNDKPASVMEKAFTPPSGTKHDYMSMAPYFWPDPSKPDGVPYMRKDGQRNPEIKKISDHELLSDLDNKCKFLSLAYYFTSDDKYAAKAKQLLSVWFLDADTKMNPNLNYAQAIRGVNDGRGIGIIETRALANLADWMGLLAGSKSFTSTDLNNIKSWYADYLTWMQTSKNGIDEHHSKNNHGTHYDTQVAAFALFTGNTQLAKQILTDAKKRITVQIEPDGQQPLELARTNAYGYSTMNLNGWFSLGMLGDKVGVDLFNYTTPDGRSIHTALDWLMPYALGDKPKDHQQISKYNPDEFYRLLVIAGNKYHNAAYTQKANAMPKNNGLYIDDLLYN
jgi:hypothetical protein